MLKNSTLGRKKKGEKNRSLQVFSAANEFKAILGYMRLYFNHVLPSQKYILGDNWTFQHRMFVTKG